MGPADGEGWDIERDSMVTWWLSFTYYSMNTRDRRSQTGNGLSYKLSQYTLRIISSYSPFSANKTSFRKCSVP